MFRSHVLVCGSDGAVLKNLVDNMNELVEKYRLKNDVKVLMTYSLTGDDKISLIVYPEGTQYFNINLESMERIVKDHLLNGKIVKDLLAHPEEKTEEEIASETEFINRQFRMVLKNCGNIDPESIDEYIAQDGYQALGKVLTQMTPEQVVEEM